MKKYKITISTPKGRKVKRLYVDAASRQHAALVAGDEIRAKSPGYVIRGIKEW